MGLVQKTRTILNLEKAEYKSMADGNIEEFDNVKRKDVYKPNVFDIVCWLVLLLTITLAFRALVSPYFIFSREYDYKRVFGDDIEISSRHTPNTQLHSVKVNFKNKNLKLEHRIVPSDEKTTQTSDKYPLTNDYLFNHMLDFNSKEDQEIRLFDKERYEFKMSRMDRHTFKQDVETIECYNVNVTNRVKSSENSGDIEVCFNIADDYWYGGHESHDQPYWPINPQVFDPFPYQTGFGDAWSGMQERYWISSGGAAIFVGLEVALFVGKTKSEICLKSSNTTYPYIYTPVYRQDEFSYNVCHGPDIKTLQMFMINNFIGKPEFPPDKLMMQLPIWTTWNLFFREINTTLINDFAQQIAAHNYSCSQLEIDDKWEKNYGDLEFDEKFGDVNQLVDNLHSLGFRVTLWVHPFCNIDSYNFVPGTYQGFWARDSGGELPAFTDWWDSNMSVILDTTNPDSLKYFTEKLEYLKTKYNIDSFKFDAGEAAFLPSKFSLFNKNATLATYSQNYVKMAANQSRFIEVHVGIRLQKIGIFYRLGDRSTSWSLVNGLRSIVPATLHLGLIGYPFVLPDIIGGDTGMDKSMKELFIRWVQLTAFLPAMQFGVPPWFFDKETDDLTRHYISIREKLIFPYMWTLAEALDGQPIIRPLWWIDPLDSNSFNISDQFLIGDQILVAPVLEQNATSRDIYLPAGIWIDFETMKPYTGPLWIINYPAPLKKIPLFFVNNNSMNITSV